MHINYKIKKNKAHINNTIINMFHLAYNLGLCLQT